MRNATVFSGHASTINRKESFFIDEYERHPKNTLDTVVFNPSRTRIGRSHTSERKQTQSKLVNAERTQADRHRPSDYEQQNGVDYINDHADFPPPPGTIRLHAAKQRQRFVEKKVMAQQRQGLW